MLIRVDAYCILSYFCHFVIRKSHIFVFWCKDVCHIFQTIKHTYNALIFSKMECVPYSLVHLKCEPGCPLSPSLNKFYVAISANNTVLPTSTRFFLRANFLFFSCNQITYSNSFYKCIFLFTLLVQTYMCIAHVPILIKCDEFLFH